MSDASTRTPHLRALGAGLFAGALLACARAPRGLDLISLPAVDGPTRALFGAVPWILLAGLLGRPARAFARGIPIGALLGGVALGLALVHQVAGTLVTLETRLSIGLALFACAAGVWLCVRGAPEPSRGADGPEDEERLSPFAWVGLIAAGAGVAQALAALELHLEHLGLGTPQEAALRGVVLAGLVFIGAVAFGPLLPARLRAGALPLALAFGAAAALLPLHFLGGLQDQRGLDGYLRRFGLDFSFIGMLGPTALIGALIFVAPGLLLGTAAAGATHRMRASALLLGVGVGVALWPLAIEATAPPARGAPELYAFDGPTWTHDRVALGVLLTACGAIAAVFASRGRRRWLLVAPLARAAVSPYLVPRRPIWILSPWHRVPVEPDLALHTGDGLLTVERDRSGTRFVTLERRRLTPIAGEESLDAMCFDVAWALLPEATRARDNVRVLLIGAMTPARAFHLGGYPNASVDHVVPWDPHRAAVDALLFEDGEPPGHAVEPAEARRRLAGASYDLVVAPPTQGPLVMPRSAKVIPWAAPPVAATAGWSAPEETVVVAWLLASAPIANAELGEQVVLAARGLDDLAVGVVLNAPDEPRPGGPTLYDAGDPGGAQGALAYLRTRPERRDNAARAALAERLRAANPTGPEGALLEGLARHLAAQEISSPFETLAMQVELDDAALEALARSLDGPPDRFDRQIWEGLAGVLVGKRMPDKVLAFIEPVAEAHRPWPVLERAVATAYEEFVMPAEAAAWLGRAIEASPYDIDLLVEAAEWTGRAGDGEGEVALVRRALAIQPDRRDLKRLLAIALVRAGDPEGRPLIEELLAEKPEDEELALLLAPGPHARPEAMPPGVSGLDDGHTEGDRHNR